jgi:GT2 family glycosyltransferase
VDKKVSVIIPFYNKWELTHKVMLDLYTYNREYIHEIVLVDDGSTDDEIVGGIKWWRHTYGMTNDNIKIRHLRTINNGGFLKAANEGMETAVGDIKILLSNDILAPCGFVKDVVRILEVPKTLVGGRILDYDTGWNKFYDRLYPYLEGWLLACTKDAWEELGGFDIRYMPNDYEDVDLSTAALSKEYSLVPLNNPRIVHLGAQSLGYNPKREAITKINQEKFRQKWVNVEKE